MTYGMTVLFITLLLIVLLLIILVLLFGYRNYGLVQSSAVWNKLIEEKVTLAILDDSTRISQDPELTALTGNDHFKKIFLSVLIASEQKFSGDALHVLIDIFYAFGLDSLAWEKFRSSDNMKKVRGLQALTAMRVEKALPEIIPLLSHHDRSVVAEAQYAVVRFQGFEGFEFLKPLSSPLSEWQQLRLLQAVKDFRPAHMDLLEELLRHSNVSIVALALTLVRKFRVHSTHDSITTLLSHEHVEVRASAVRTLQSIENESTIPLLTAVYADQDDRVKKAIMKALLKSLNRKSTEFLKTVLAEGNVALQLLAAETLSALKETDYLRALLLKETVPPQVQSVVKHALAIKL